MGVINKGFCETFRLGNHTYQVIGNTAEGEQAKVNQDSFGIFYNNECLILVVADGLGSAPFSHTGSYNIVESTFEVMSERNSEKIWERIHKTWESSIMGNPEEYDTTCKFICIRDETVSVGSIGDGWLGIMVATGYHEVENHNSFTNRTESICSQNLDEKACLFECGLEDFLAVGMSTDGFSEDLDRTSRGEFLNDATKVMADDLNAMYTEICSVLKNWPVSSNKDDKTLILIRKVE